MVDRQKSTVDALMERHGRTVCEDLRISIEQGTPAPLFSLLVAALLYSARISADLAGRAARALSDAGWTTPDKMAAATWDERVGVLNAAGYARYDERTARMLGETAEAILAEYGGDLRRLRDAARRDPAEERRRLKAFKGIGDVGVDIFMREAQAAWPELYPFVDGRAKAAAGKLDLPVDAEALARLIPREAFPRLVAALVRIDLAGDYAAIEAAVDAD